MIQIFLATGFANPLFATSDAPISSVSTTWGTDTYVLDSGQLLVLSDCLTLSLAGVPKQIGSATSGTCSLQISTQSLVKIDSNSKVAQTISTFKSSYDWTLLTFTREGSLKVYANDMTQLYQLEVNKRTLTNSKAAPFTVTTSVSVLTNGALSLTFDKATGSLTLAGSGASSVIFAGGKSGSYSLTMQTNGVISVSDQSSSVVFSSLTNSFNYPAYLQLDSNGYLTVTDNKQQIINKTNVCQNGKSLVSSVCTAFTCTVLGCKLCSYSDSMCSACNSPFTLRDGVCYCSLGFYKDSNSCTACASGCQTCDSGSKCLYCKSGFYLINSVCTAMASMTDIQASVVSTQTNSVFTNVTLKSQTAFDYTSSWYRALFINTTSVRDITVISVTGSSKTYYLLLTTPIALDNGTLCIYSNPPASPLYFKTICLAMGGWDAPRLSKGYSSAPLTNQSYQWYNVGCTISLVALLIALYYYRLQTVQLQTTFVFSLQIFYFLGLQQNNFSVELQSLLNGFGFANLLFVPNMFAITVQTVDLTSSKYSQVLGGLSFISNVGSSVTTILLVSVGFFIFWILSKITLAKQKFKLVFSDSTMLRGKYLTLFILSLVQLNIFYFSISELIYQRSLPSFAQYSKVNVAFAIIGIIIVCISFLLNLLYNLYIDLRTPDQQSFSFRIHGEFTTTLFSSVEQIRRLVQIILLATLYTNMARATILIVEVLYLIWLFVIAKRKYYKVLLLFHEILNVVVFCMLLFLPSGGNIVGLVLLVITSAVFELITWHINLRQDIIDKSLKVIDIDK